MQNYKTIDKSSIKPGAYLKLSAILDSDEPHFVVAQYAEGTNASQEEYFSILQECWHFKGPMAELDAHNFYCSMLPELADDFEYKPAESYGSHVAERHYKAN